MDLWTLLTVSENFFAFLKEFSDGITNVCSKSYVTVKKLDAQVLKHLEVLGTGCAFMWESPCLLLLLQFSKVPEPLETKMQQKVVVIWVLIPFGAFESSHCCARRNILKRDSSQPEFSLTWGEGHKRVFLKYFLLCYMQGAATLAQHPVPYPSSLFLCKEWM